MKYGNKSTSKIRNPSACKGFKLLAVFSMESLAEQMERGLYPPKGGNKIHQ